MGTIYWRADEPTMGFITDIMMRFHNELYEHKVLIGVIMAMSGDEEKSALKHHGYPVAACIRVVPLKDRISKNYDAEMMIDASLWKAASNERRAALIDHELSHIRLKRMKPAKTKDRKTEEDVKGEVKYDDIGRPMLESVKGDYNVGDGFLTVIQRHMENSFETTNINTAMSIIEQVMDTAPEQE